jgi:hypothetical protein
VATDIATSSAPDAGLERTSGDKASRVALFVFVVAVAVAVPLYLWRGRHQWFYLDEWDFLAGRSATSWHDLVRPHNEHWSTVPIVVYRLMWRMFGLRTYTPYQLMTITLHLTAACLLRVIMRRAQVRPWTATCAAAVFVFLGTGHENILWAFQIGFVASLVCGLVHVILADHDGGFDRRDLGGLAFGVIGLMCSGVGVTMVAIVGISTLIRRGWRISVLHVAPLATLFLLWWLAWGRSAYTDEGSAKLGDEVHAAAIGFANVFVQLAQNSVAAIALVVLLAIGAYVGWKTQPAFRSRAAAPFAMLCGAPILLAITAAGRVGKADIAIRLGVFDSIDDTTRVGRYVELLAAFVLPALAIAVDVLIKRWRVLVPVLAVLLFVSLWGNIDAIQQGGLERFRLGNKAYVLAIEQAPLAAQLPNSTRPMSLGGPEVTMGWLRAGVRSGRIPTPSYSRSNLATVGLSLALVQRQAAAGSDCVALHEPIRRRLRPGRSFGFSDAPISIVLVDNGTTSQPVVYSPAAGHVLFARAGPLLLEISPPARGTVPRICA